MTQHGSVPFLWEEKPGTPKKDWKPETIPINNVPPLAKLVASIPFKWEEKPGKPLPSFLQPNTNSPLLTFPPLKLIGFPSPSVYSPKPSPSIHEDNDDEEEEEMFDLGPETNSFDTDEGPTLAPSLLANRLMSSAVISTAIPVNQNVVKGSYIVAENHYVWDENQASPVSETDSNPSSYATGSSSFMGASFFECLFPLFSPDTGFPKQVGFHEKSSSLTLPDPRIEELGCQSNSGLVTKRTPTLGELILMSRRRNHVKSTHIRKRNLPLEFIKKRVFGSCIFGIGGNGVDHLHRKQQRLKALQLV